MDRDTLLKLYRRRMVAQERYLELWRRRREESGATPPELADACRRAEDEVRGVEAEIWEFWRDGGAARASHAG